MISNLGWSDLDYTEMHAMTYVTPFNDSLDN